MLLRATTGMACQRRYGELLAHWNICIYMPQHQTTQVRRAKAIVRMKILRLVAAEAV
jgi:hypothetical protein